MAKQKNYHVGGQQMPMFVPESDWKRPTALPDLRRMDLLAVDTEEKDDGLAQGRGPGWAYGAGHIAGLSAAWRENGEIKKFYAPIRHPDSDNFDPDQVKRWYLDHVKAGVRMVFQHAPYDVGWTNREWGAPCPEKVDDTTCMAYMIDENRLSYDLDALCAWRGVPGKDETLLREAAAAYGLDPKKDLWRMPARFVGPYAEQDPVATLLLRESLLPDITAQRVEDAYQLEMDLLPMVHAMRKRGIRVDLDRAEEAKERLIKISADTFKDITDRLADAGFANGSTVSIDEARSNSWLESAFTHCREAFPRSPDGRGSFEAKWMKNREHWLPQLLVKAKAAHEAAHKFLQGYVIDFAHLGRLHASINQFRSEDGGTRTYRFSYSDPPLQQMPNRDELISALVRGAFLPEDGELWLAADYSQQEYRLIVHYADMFGLDKAASAAERYRNDPRTDFHSLVAELTGLERKPAKDSNFAKSYGAGIDKFAAMINKTKAEAAAIMEQYDREMPFNAQLFEKCKSKAERSGFMKLFDGARIHYDQWEPAYLSKEERARGYRPGSPFKMNPCSAQEARLRCSDKEHPWYGKRLRRANCRKAMNGLIQGGAARQTKKAMRACWREGFLPLLQMHDELDFSVSREQDGRRITELMREVVKLRVPMQVDAEYGVTWGRAKADKKTGYDASWKAARAELKAA